MARPLRIAFEGAFYHVTARGNERRKGTVLFYELSNDKINRTVPFSLFLIYRDGYNRLVRKGWGGYPEITFKEHELDEECSEYLRSLIQEAN
jgi:hypothetical protein